MAGETRGRWVELAIVGLVLANAAAYVWAFPSVVSLTWFSYGPKEALGNGTFLEWLASENYYPPLYPIWMALSPGGLRPPSCVWMATWSNLLVACGFLSLACALRRLGAGTAVVAAALFFLAGSPVVNAQTMQPHPEVGLFAATGLLLWALAREEGLPGRAGSAAVGLAVAAGMLFKWTFVLYAAGPLAVAASRAVKVAGVREVSVRLGILAGVAAIVAGPWYVGVLDWERLRASAGNDASFPGVSGLRAYLLHVGLYLEVHITAIGITALPLMLAGLTLAYARRPTGAGLVFASIVGPALVLSAVGHQEPRYLLASLPGLAGAAALGIGTLGRRMRTCAAVSIALVAIGQAGFLTWYCAAGGCRQEGEWYDRGSTRFLVQMQGQTGADARRARDRCLFWTHKLSRPGERFSYAVHPLEVTPGMKWDQLRFLDLSDPDPRSPLTVEGYVPGLYLRFMNRLLEGGFAFVLVSRATLALEMQAARGWMRNGWNFVTVMGDRPDPRPSERPPDDPFAIEQIEARYGTIDTLDTAGGPVYLLIRRDLHARIPGLRPLGALPRIRERTVWDLSPWEPAHWLR